MTTISLDVFQNVLVDGKIRIMYHICSNNTLLVTAASKLFEICFLGVLEAYLQTHDHQFEFKSRHFTDMCIFTVIRLINYYTN